MNNFIERIITRAALAAASLILFSFSADARRVRQQECTIKGTVIEAGTGEGIGWATVAILDSENNVITGQACDENGNYLLPAQTGECIIRVSMMGYNDATLELNLVAGTNELDPISLTPDTQMLASATVTERVKLVEMKIDKVVMNVSQSAFSQGSNALDLIKKAPGVTIDKDGNIKLNGKSVQIWIDGRPSHVDGKTLESLLRGTNGESIDKFEIMEHPSAKYDAAGQGGIINIKTKKTIFQGLNGSMGLGAGGMRFSEADLTPWQQSYWLNLNNRTKKTNTFFSIYEGFYNTPMHLTNSMGYNMSDGTRFEQMANSTLLNFYHNYNVKLGTDWFIDDKNTVGAILYVPGDYGTFDTRESNTDVTIGDAPFSNTIAKIQNRNRSIQYMGNLNYTHIFDPNRAAEMTANLDYYRNVGSENNNQKDTTMAAGIMTPSMKQIDANKIYDVYSAKVDYQSVIFGKYMFETGAKWALSKTDNYSKEVETAKMDIVNDFDYSEHVAAAYVTAAGQFGPKFSAKLGLRGEFTNSFGDWHSSNSTTSRSYFDLFPTVFLGYNPSEKFMFAASYTRRIDRPNYSQLNPTKTYIDARTYIVGNPEIQPMYSNDMTLSMTFMQHFTLAAGFAATNNAVTQIPTYEDGIAYLTWGNFGSHTMGYIAANVASYPVTKWLQWTMSANALYITSTSDMTGVSRSNLSAQAYTALSFMLPKDWKLDVDASYSAPMEIDAYRVRSTFVSNLAIKKNLLGDKMTFTIRLDDIFRTQAVNIDLIDITGAGSESTILQKYYTQKLIFDLTWNFGTAHNTRKRNVGVLDELKRAGSSGLGGK